MQISLDSIGGATTGLSTYNNLTTGSLFGCYEGKQISGDEIIDTMHLLLASLNLYMPSKLQHYPIFGVSKNDLSRWIL